MADLKERCVQSGTPSYTYLRSFHVRSAMTAKIFLQSGKRKNINWKAQFNFNMGTTEEEHERILSRSSEERERDIAP